MKLPSYQKSYFVEQVCVYFPCRAHPIRWLNFTLKPDSINLNRIVLDPFSPSIWTGPYLGYSLDQVSPLTRSCPKPGFTPNTAWITFKFRHTKNYFLNNA